MLSFNNDYIGYEPAEHNVLFSGSDSKELYAQNLKSKPNDWYYRTNRVSYIRNSNGHRCKEIKDIDLSNYILYAGCSHTEGIGLELENTYPYLLSKSLKCDYYNLGVGGSGYDVLTYNLITWFSKVKRKPKIVIIQWPESARFVVKNPNRHSNTNSLVTCGPWSTEVGVDKFCVLGYDIDFFETRRTIMYKLIKNFIDCPISEFAFNHAKFNDDIISLTPGFKDYARDVHYGILSHINYTSIIKAIIRDKYKYEFKNI